MNDCILYLYYIWITVFHICHSHLAEIKMNNKLGIHLACLGFRHVVTFMTKWNVERMASEYWLLLNRARLPWLRKGEAGLVITLLYSSFCLGFNTIVWSGLQLRGPWFFPVNGSFLIYTKKIPRNTHFLFILSQAPQLWWWMNENVKKKRWLNQITMLAQRIVLIQTQNNKRTQY